MPSIVICQLLGNNSLDAASLFIIIFQWTTPPHGHVTVQSKACYATLPPLASPGPGRSEGEVDELCALLADDGLLVAAGDVVPRHAVLNIGAENVNQFDIDTFDIFDINTFDIGFR